MQIVTIFIKNKKDEYLIQKRSKAKGGKYGITSGHTLEGESAEKGAIREIKEEIGIDIVGQELKLIYKTNIDGNLYNLYYLEKDIELKNLKLQKEEVENVYWYTIDEINKIIQKQEFYLKQIEALKIFEKYIKEEEKWQQ